MIKAAQYALSGLLNASQRFEASARNIANDPAVNQTQQTFSQNDGNAATDQEAENGGTLPTSPLATSVTAFEDTPSLTESAVSLKEAELSYKANATVLQAINETQDEVLEILA